MGTSGWAKTSWGILDGRRGMRSVLPTSPRNGPGRACQGGCHRGGTGSAGRSCVLVTAGLGASGRGDREGVLPGGQAVDQLSILPGPGPDLCRIRPCAAGYSPRRAHKGLWGQAEAECVKASHVHRAAAGPGLASHPLHPSPLVCIFINIYRNIYDAKCNRDETPHWPGSPCVSISPQTVTYLVLLGVLVPQDRVLGRLHIFLLLVLLLLFGCFPTAGDPVPLGQGWLWGAACPPRQLPDCAKCLELLVCVV